MKQDVSVQLTGGKSLSFETGKLAKQAHGSVVVRIGESVVLATAVSNPDPREGIDFFPLTVDYREYTYAGGRIPGGFIKREGRPSEREILTSRQIDRPIRPLFPEGFKCETQVIAFVLSADTENDPDVAGINGASAALTISDIPFNGPIGAVRVGLVSGQFIINPTYSEMRDSLLNIMVVGTADGIVMIESGAKEVKEETVVDAIEFAHTEIKKICAAINDLKAKAGKPKRAVTPPEFDEVYYGHLRAKIGNELAEGLDTQKHPKAESYNLVRDLKKRLQAEIPERRRRSAGQTKSLLRNPAGTNLPRASNQQQEKTRRPPLRQSPRHLGRSRSAAPNPRQRHLHPRRNPSPGNDNIRHQRRQATPGNLRRRSQKALPSPLQFSAVLGWGSLVFARGWTAGDWTWGACRAGYFCDVTYRGELALHHARGLRHFGVEWIFFHGDRLRGFAFFDGCGGSA